MTNQSGVMPYGETSLCSKLNIPQEAPVLPDNFSNNPKLSHVYLALANGLRSVQEQYVTKWANQRVCPISAII
jgi:hypothetical protein